MVIQETIDTLFSYEEMGIRRFSKDTYAPSFEKFQEIAEEFDRALASCYEQSVEKQHQNMECFATQIAEDFVNYIKEHRQEDVSKSKQEELQHTHNLFMAVYVLPHIMEMRNPYYQEVAKAIERVWSASFKNSKIKAASFESVAGGFQKKFLGFSL